MTTIDVPYSALVQAQADAKGLLLIVDLAAPLGTTIEVYPQERPDVVSGTAWQPEPGGRWRAIRSFLDPEGQWFDSADEAVLFALTGGPITKRLGYVLHNVKKVRR